MVCLNAIIGDVFPLAYYLGYHMIISDIVYYSVNHKQKKIFVDVKIKFDMTSQLGIHVFF